MDSSAYRIDVPMALDPTFDIDLDKIFNGENATPHQSFQQAELYPAFNQGDFASTNVFHGEGYQNFLPQDELALYDLFQPGLEGNTFNQENFPMTENLLQPQIDGTFQQDQMTFVGALSQALFYDNIGRQGFHGTGILQSAGHPYMPESLGSDQASSQVNFQSSVQQADLTTSLENIEQPCVDPVGVANQSRYPDKSGAAVVSDDDKNSIRKRAAQALPKQQSQKEAVPWAFVKDLVPKVLADKTYKNHGDIINHLEKLVKGLFDKGNKNGWTYNEFTLVPPSGAKDNSKTWQFLTHQYYSTSTLAECGLSSRVTLSLQRLFVGLHQAAKICNPKVLIYFWNVCISLSRISLSGMPKTQGYPLLRLLLAALEKSFSNSRKSSERTHSMINFLRSLSSVLKEDPRDIRGTLEMGYKKVIETIGDVIGHDHAVVLNMVSHYAKYYNAHIIVDKVSPKSILERYKHLIEVVENTCGSSEKEKIALLYDYIRATSLSEIDYGVVLKLQERTAEICKTQQHLKCCLTTRAFAFSIELLANMHFEKEMAETKALRKKQVHEEKKAISKNRALVEKRALAEQKSPLEAKEIANKKAIAEKKRLAREKSKKEIAEAKEIAREQKQAEINAIAKMRSLPERRALAENQLPSEVMEIAKKTAVAQKKTLAEKKKEEALAMKRRFGIQGPELPPKQSHTHLSKVIAVL